MTKHNINGSICPLDPKWIEASEDALQKIETMHEMLSNIGNHTQYLSKLEPISSNLESLAENNTKLIDIVSGKKHIPIAFGVFLLILVGVLMVVLVIKETKTNVKVGTDGVTINGGG